MLGKTYTAVDVGVIQGVPDKTALFFFFAAFGVGHMIKFLPNICQGKPQPRLLKELNTGQPDHARSDSSERKRKQGWRFGRRCGERNTYPEVAGKTDT